ncbi:MAG: hypothetical protein JRI68_03055 [Deltaproteobacteria bacterium]|nr:hypothetical protein [Deltaproteobacteria bacterium]
MGGVKEGVERVAKAAGLPALRVFRRLPMERMELLIDELETSQREALLLLRAKPELGGESAEPEQSGEPVAASDVVSELRRFAAGREDGDALAATLVILADKVEQWLDVLAESRATITKAPLLSRAYRRRGLKRLAVAALVTVVVTGGGTWLVQRHLAQTRIDALLGGDPCAAEQGVDPKDLERASSAQRATVDRLRRECQEGRERARREAEELRLAEEKRRAEERRVKERLEQCAQLGKHFEAGKLDEADSKLAGKHAGLLQRLLAGELSLDDVSDDLGELPCAGTEAVKPLRRAFAGALLDAKLKWLPKRAPSKAARLALVEHRADLDHNALLHFGGHIEMMAVHSVATGVELQRHAVLCALAAELKTNPGVNCQAVAKLAREAK